jgi:hypothetical protein
MARPRGFTFIALLSFWTGLAAIPQALSAGRVLPTICAALLAICSIVAGVALWRCVRWAHLAFLAATFAALANLSASHFVLGQPSTRQFWAGQMIAAGILSMFVYRYVRVELAALARAADSPDRAVQADRATRDG